MPTMVPLHVLSMASLEQGGLLCACPEVHGCAADNALTCAAVSHQAAAAGQAAQAGLVHGSLAHGAGHLGQLQLHAGVHAGRQRPLPHLHFAHVIRAIHAHLLRMLWHDRQSRPGYMQGWSWVMHYGGGMLKTKHNAASENQRSVEKSVLLCAT